jgi:hypothetical protein
VWGGWVLTLVGCAAVPGAATVEAEAEPTRSLRILNESPRSFSDDEVWVRVYRSGSDEFLLQARVPDSPAHPHLMLGGLRDRDRLRLEFSYRWQPDPNNLGFGSTQPVTDLVRVRVNGDMVVFMDWWPEMQTHSLLHEDVAWEQRRATYRINGRSGGWF